MPLLREPDVLPRLAPHLPEEHRSQAALEELVGSAQFRAQLDTFGSALQAGQLDLAQFGLQAEARAPCRLALRLPRSSGPLQFAAARCSISCHTWRFTTLRAVQAYSYVAAAGCHGSLLTQYVWDSATFESLTYYCRLVMLPGFELLA